MHPYRDSAGAERPKQICDAHWDDYVLALLFIVLGAIRVALAFATGETFGPEATIAAVMLGLGTVLGASTLARQ